MKRYQKMSRLYAPTLKEDPAEAELVSHKLLLRAGMIRKTAAGLYSYLPLAWRVISKVEDVIRDEMEGIGVSRMVSAIVEQHNDENGICWPVCVAPYEVEVVPLNVGDDLVWPEAQRVTDELSTADLEVLLDDRSERPGVKFADADLIGLPWQVILGKRGVKEGMAEVKCRATGERFDVPMDELASWLSERIVSERA